MSDSSRSSLLNEIFDVLTSEYLNLVYPPPGIDREMKMMITKADTGETELKGTYKIRVAPEGASSATSGPEEGCVRMVDVGKSLYIVVHSCT